MTAKTIEVFPGPEFEILSEDQRSNLFQQEFTIDKNNNRMAIQLNEEVKNNLDSIITGPVIPGTVQLTPAGKLIVLMKDCQTTGGYPRVLHLSEKSLNIISQKLMGESVNFSLKKNA